MLTPSDVTPARIALAYQRTGIACGVHDFSSWYEPLDPRDQPTLKCACPATVLACDCYMLQGGTRDDFERSLRTFSGSTIGYLAKLTGLENHELIQIANGWDWDSLAESVRFQRGSALFLAARQARRELYPAEVKA